MDELPLGLPDQDPADGELAELRRAVDAAAMPYRVWRAIGPRGGFYVRRERSSPPWCVWRATPAEVVSAVRSHEGMTTP